MTTVVAAPVPRRKPGPRALSRNAGPEAPWAPAFAGEQKLRRPSSSPPYRNRFGEVEPAVVKRAAGDHALDAVRNMRAPRVDVVDIGNAPRCDHRNVDRRGQRHRRLDIAALEQPVAADVGEQQRRNARILEPPRQILDAHVGHIGPALGRDHAIAGVDRWLALGVERVIIGTAALKDPEFVKSAARDLPGRIVVGVDARDGMVATEGWADVSDVRVEDLARRFEDAGVAALLFTDVGRDGLLKGCNVEATVALAQAVAIPVIASGGVADIGDIHALCGHVADGIEGVITGRALYDGRLDLAEAIAAGAA